MKMETKNDEITKIVLKKFKSVFYEEDLELLKNPKEWTLFPLMPLKRKNKNSGLMEFAFIITPDVTILHLGMYLKIPLEGKHIDDFKTKKYTSIEEILNDRWEIDHS
jgi:hypothetical protein